MTIASIPEPLRPTETLMGERIHHLLWRSKITQTAFAKRLGLSQTALSRKLRGERALTLDEILIVSRELGVSLDYLFGNSDDGGPDAPKVRPTDYEVADSAEGNSASVVDLFTRERVGA